MEINFTYDLSMDSLTLPPDLYSYVDYNDIDTGIIAASCLLVIFLYAIFTAANLMLIIAIVTKPELRSCPSNWLLINIATCFLMEGFLFVTSTYNELHLFQWWFVHGLCEGIYIIWHITALTTPLSVLLLTIDKLISIIKSSGTEPGFSKGVAILSTVGVVVFAIIIMAVASFGLGDGFIYYHGGQCMLSLGFFGLYVINILFLIVLLTIFILTILVAVFWCKAKLAEVGKAALPLVVANLFYIILVLPYGIGILCHNHIGQLTSWTAHIFTILRYQSAASGIIVPLMWLVCLRELRQSYREICCPCCPKDKQDGETIHLLHN